MTGISLGSRNSVSSGGKRKLPTGDKTYTASETPALKRYKEEDRGNITLHIIFFVLLR